MRMAVGARGNASGRMARLKRRLVPISSLFQTRPNGDYSITMKNSETLIEKLAFRRAEAVVTQSPASAANEFQAGALQVLAPEVELSDYPEPEQSRGGWRSWLLALGVVLLGFWMFTAVVGPKPSATPQPVANKAQQVEGTVARQTVSVPAPKPPVVSVPMSDSAPAAAALPPSSPKPKQASAESSTRPSAVRPQAPTKNLNPASSWRETVAPLPAYNEANDGSIDRSAQALPGPTKSPAAVLPTPAATDKSVHACASMGGLALAQCRRCDTASGLGKPFCREQVRLEYCQGRYGKAAECPLVGYANGF
jgi:hypothetical protein